MILNEETYHLLKAGDRIQRVEPRSWTAIVIKVYPGSAHSSFDYKLDNENDGTTHSWMLTSPPTNAWTWITPPSSWWTIWR